MLPDYLRQELRSPPIRRVMMPVQKNRIFAQFLLIMKMKNLSVAVLFSITVSTITAAQALEIKKNSKRLSSSAPVINPSKKNSMSLPTTPQELWPRILLLLQTNNGFVSKEQIEKTLGMHFTSTEKENEKGTLGAEFRHIFKENSPGFGRFSVGMFDDPKIITFTILWGESNTVFPNCLALDDAQKNLETLGWAAGTRSQSPGPGAIQFFRADLKERTPNDEFGKDAVSQLTLYTPNQLSQCVNGFIGTISASLVSNNLPKVGK